MSLITKRTALTVTSIAIAAILVANSAQARERGARGERVDRVTKQFERLDTNDDGVLSLDELTVPALAKAEKKLARKDADEDGFLTYEEVIAGRQEPVDLTEFAEEIAQCVADLKAETGNENIADLDPADYVSPQQKFDNADTNGDALLDLAELQAVATEKAATKFANLDTDENGEISLEEFTAGRTSRSATRRAIKACKDEILDEEGI